MRNCLTSELYAVVKHRVSPKHGPYNLLQHKLDMFYLMSLIATKLH